jgi:hypothetical protein
MLKKRPLALSLTLLGAFSSSATIADSAEIQALKQQLQAITERLVQLEQPQAAEHKQLSPRADQRSSSEQLSFYGLVEVEASYSDEDDSGSSSDLVVATVEVGVEVPLTEQITANVSALYEEDETDLEIDVATISINDLANTDVTLTLGQDYLPFGAFQTNMINDTLVLEAAEMRETAAIASWQQAGVSLTAYCFNGDIDEGKDTIENYGASIGWSNEQFSLAADYVSNILDSDGLSDAFEEELGDLGDIDQTEGAYILRGRGSLAALELFAEYLKTERFTIGSFINRELEVLHLEAATQLGDWTVAIALQETDDGEELLPEQRFSLGASTSLSEQLGLGIEYWHDQDYHKAKSDNLILQLSVEF